MEEFLAVWGMATVFMASPVTLSSLVPGSHVRHVHNGKTPHCVRKTIRGN